MLNYAKQVQQNKNKNKKHVHLRHPKQHICPDNHAQTSYYAMKRAKAKRGEKKTRSNLTQKSHQCITKSSKPYKLAINYE